MKHALAALLLLTGFFIAQADNAAYLRLIDNADKAAAKQEWDAAEGFLKEAMTSDPSNPQNVMLLSNVGMYQFYRGEDSLALHTLSEARAIAPASVVILQNRAKVLTSMGRTADALADLNKVIEMDSVNYNAYFNRGYLRHTSGDSIGARSDFAKLQQLRPDDPNTLLVLAVMYSGSNQFDEAISYYNALIKKVEKPEYYTGRAMARLAKGDLAEASDDIGRGLELNPEDGELYFCRAYLHLMQYRREDAKADAALARKYGVEEERITELFSEQ